MDFNKIIQLYKMKTTAEFHLINIDNQTSTFKVEKIICIYIQMCSKNTND
jgi:hypothetical protein